MKPGRRWLLGHLLLSKALSDDLRGYRLQPRRRTCSTAREAHPLGSRCLRTGARTRRLVDRSPFPRRFAPEDPGATNRSASDDEIERVLAVPELYAFIVRLGLGTGLRGASCSSSCRPGFLLRARSRSDQERQGPARSASPRLARRDSLAYWATALAQGRGRVAIQVRWHSGVKKFHAHQLRHTFACRWLEAGGSLAALQEILGHASIVTTQRYGRLSDAHVEAEAARIQGRFGTNSGTEGLR